MYNNMLPSILPILSGAGGSVRISQFLFTRRADERCTRVEPADGQTLTHGQTGRQRSTYRAGRAGGGAVLEAYIATCCRLERA